MKKIFLIAIAAVGMMTANAQQVLEATNFGSNWSIGIDAGATSPLKSLDTNKNMIDNARALVGIHIDKQISPVFGVGVEAAWGINTSTVSNTTATYGKSNKLVFDNSYVGAYGTVNFMNLFGGYKCQPRLFEIEAVAGAGWGHIYRKGYLAKTQLPNYFATKAGLNLNFNITKNFTLALKPSVTFNMTNINSATQQPQPYPIAIENTSCGYNIKNANLNVMIGATYHFGPGFVCAPEPCDPNVIAALNAEINGLRAQLEGCVADLGAAAAANAALQAELQACLKRPATVKEKVVEKVSNNLESVRYVYFAQSSSAISADQMRTVDIIASFMKNHKDSKLNVKGYASPEGNLEFNKKLAAARAESVKNAIVKKGINANRVVAEGEGIGKMFEEPTWNRVAICTLDK